MGVSLLGRGAACTSLRPYSDACDGGLPSREAGARLAFLALPTLDALGLARTGLPRERYVEGCTTERSSWAMLAAYELLDKYICCMESSEGSGIMLLPPPTELIQSRPVTAEPGDSFLLRDTVLPSADGSGPVGDSLCLLCRRRCGDADDDGFGRLRWRCGDCCDVLDGDAESFLQPGLPPRSNTEGGEFLRKDGAESCGELGDKSDSCDTTRLYILYAEAGDSAATGLATGTLCSSGMTLRRRRVGRGGLRCGRSGGGAVDTVKPSNAAAFARLSSGICFSSVSRRTDSATFVPTVVMVGAADPTEARREDGGGFCTSGSTRCFLRRRATTMT